MSIVQNTLSAIGDAIIIKTGTPTLGLSGISDFTDTVSGETASRFFTKFFRYSKNNLDFSEWVALTDQKLQELSVSPRDEFYIEYKYVRSGTDDSGLLSFSSISLVGTFVDFSCGPTFASSIFSKFFTCNLDISITQWARNVLNKTYGNNIVPTYINKTLDGEAINVDYDSFWRSVSHFFAILVRQARLFDNVLLNDKILSQYLLNKQVPLCGNESLLELQNLAKNRLSLIAKRGSSRGLYGFSEFDSDIARLICKDVADELFHTSSSKGHWGWCVGQTSPCYKGVDHDPSFWKSYELSEGLTDPSKYDLVGSGHSFLEGMVTLPPGSGIGRSIFSDGNEAAITVSPNVSYAISLLIECDEANSENLSIGVRGIDSDGNEVLLKSLDGSSDSVWCFEDVGCLIAAQQYLIQLNIFSSDENLRSTQEATLAFGSGLHKKMSSDIVKIVPFIKISENDTGSWDLAEYKVSLLNCEYGRGFIQSSPHVELFVKNNNRSLSDESLFDWIRENLIPYNMGLIINSI